MTVDCPRCEARVRAEARGEYEVKSGGFEEGPVMRERVALLSCPSCNQPFVATRTDEEVGHEEWAGGVWTGAFPGATFDLRGVPEAIGRGHREALMCFRANAYTATAVMCRRTLEAICKNKLTTKRNLAANLKELQENAVIDARLYEWADALRIVGNDAAHNVEEFMSKEDAKDGLDFTRAIIEYVYTFTDAFEKFKARRTARKAAAAVAPSGADGSTAESAS